MSSLRIAIIGGLAASAIVVLGIVVNFWQTGWPATGESNGTMASVPTYEKVSGGPPRDGIPSIDNPKFVSASDAVLENSELVLGLEVNGDSRAYPLSILVWHEIVNDEVGGEPVAVTYCPLCFTNQVFRRTIDGQIVEFGTSGKLYNCNLVMYDRTSESLWSQAMGQAISGEYAGEKLEKVPFDIARWKDWKTLNPESMILTRDTGFVRPYGADPYAEYFASQDVLFPLSHRDDRLAPKEIVIGLEKNGIYHAYRLDHIEDSRIISDTIAGKPILLVSEYPFMVRVYDRTVNGTDLEFLYKDNKIVDQTGSVWDFDGISIEGEMKGKQLTRLPVDQGFWFEWVAFHPETEIYLKP